jgi:putative membrane protein
MTSEARRLHPAAIGVLALGALRETAVPILVLLVLSVSGRGLDTGALLRGTGYLVAGVAIASLTGYMRWRSTTYWVDPEGVHLRTGVVNRKATTIPLSRVQALDTLQGPIQRLFGVLTLSVQTAGGGAKGEIVLEALAPEAVEEVREAVRERAPETTEAQEDRPASEWRRLSRPMLLVAALTAGQLGVILPVLAGASQFIDNLFTQGDEVNAASGLLPDAAAEWVLDGALVLTAAWVLSAVGAVFAFAGFAVTREGERLRLRRGFLQRSESAVPVARIHGIRVVEGVLRRPFGLASLRLVVAGYAGEASVMRMLFPLLRRHEIHAFLDELLPELADDPGGLAPPPPRSARRYVLPPAAMGAVAGGAVSLIFPAVSPWPLLAAPLLALDGWLDYRAAGWRLRDGRLAMRSRRLARVTLLARADRLQRQSLAQNPLQRRARLCDLSVAVGKDGDARVRHIDAATGDELWEQLRRAAVS